MDYHRTLHRTFEAGDRPTLRIANRSGEISVIGEDRTDIELVAQFTASADSEAEGERRLDAMQLPISEEDGVVEIGPPDFGDAAASGDAGIRIFGIRVGLALSGGFRGDMQVRVPRKCRLEAHERSGRLRVTGVEESVRVETRSGRTELSSIGGDVHFEGRSGAVEVRAVTGDLRAEVRSGRIEVEGVIGDVELRTRSGRIQVRDVEGRVVAQSHTGRVRVEDVNGPLTLSASTGAVEYRGRIVHTSSFDVARGTVRLAVTQDSSFFLDAETERGTVTADLPVNYMERPPEDAPTVRVRTGRGTVRIVAASLALIASPALIGAWQLWASGGGLPGLA
jgi:hypothetical protein